LATKTGAPGRTLVLVTAVIVGLGFFYGLSKRDLSDDASGVVLSVIFEPVQRVGFVNIGISVDGVPRPLEQVKKSPWERVVVLKKGQTVTLTAVQNVSAKLSCAVNGQVQETRTFPGSVICTHKRA